MKLRVGIVGLGDAWESRHRPALRALSDRIEVRAVCCEVAHRAELAARDEQIKALEERLAAHETETRIAIPVPPPEPEKRGPGRPPKGI